MANLKALKNRIRSVGNTQQITKAMKMVAAAKLRRAQENAIMARDFSARMGRMTRTLATHLSEAEGMPALLSGRDGEAKKVELVVYTGDRGLCGGFNSSVVRAVRAKIPELEAEGVEVSLTCLGSKGYDVLKRQYADRIRKVYRGVGKELNVEYAEREVAAELIKSFNDGTFDACYLVYNTFQSAMTQVLTWRQMIPVPLEETDEEGEEYAGNYLYEPDEEELLSELLPKNLTYQLYQAMLESEASEHGARMTAMDNAVRNADEMINKLTIQYNRQRQAGITNDLVEIISGAESLNS